MRKRIETKKTVFETDTKSTIENDGRKIGEKITGEGAQILSLDDNKYSTIIPPELLSRSTAPTNRFQLTQDERYHSWGCFGRYLRFQRYRQTKHSSSMLWLRHCGGFGQLLTPNCCGVHNSKPINNYSPVCLLRHLARHQSKNHVAGRIHNPSCLFQRRNIGNLVLGHGKMARPSAASSRNTDSAVQSRSTATGSDHSAQHGPPRGCRGPGRTTMRGGCPHGLFVRWLEQ